jgi:hypothetical protein
MGHGTVMGDEGKPPVCLMAGGFAVCGFSATGARYFDFCKRRYDSTEDARKFSADYLNFKGPRDLSQASFCIAPFYEQPRATRG